MTEVLGLGCHELTTVLLCWPPIRCDSGGGAAHALIERVYRQGAMGSLCGA